MAPIQGLPSKSVLVLSHNDASKHGRLTSCIGLHRFHRFQSLFHRTYTHRSFYHIPKHSSHSSRVILRSLVNSFNRRIFLFLTSTISTNRPWSSINMHMIALTLTFSSLQAFNLLSATECSGTDMVYITRPITYAKPYTCNKYTHSNRLERKGSAPNLHSRWLALRGSVAGGGIRERIAGPSQSVMFISEIVTDKGYGENRLVLHQKIIASR